MAKSDVASGATAAGAASANWRTGWRKLDAILVAIDQAIQNVRNEAVTRTFNERGTMASGAAAAGAAGGGGGGGGALETVTGAVNGVPATLKVMTDGAPWTEV